MVHMAAENIGKDVIPDGEYVVQRKGGGSIVDRRPVFAPDAKYLYLVWGNVVRMYSTQTGELVRDYKGLSRNAVGVQLHTTRPELVVAVSEIGEMMAWRWESGIHMMTVKLRVAPECARVIGFNLLPSKGGDCDIFASWQEKNGCQAKMSIFTSSGRHKMDVNFSFDNTSHSVAFAFGSHTNGNYVVAICKDKLYTIDLEHNKGNWVRVSGKRYLTCVACHPTELCVATGDNTGRVLVFRDIIENNSPPCAVYHWHTLPVTDIAFSHSGTFFYSGGSECVLVKWRLDSPQDKSFLPRLPAPICHLSVAKDNQLVAVSTLDNAIQLVDTQRKLTRTIQYFSWGVQSAGGGLPLFPAGLNLDPRTRSLVLNGRTGHIQFYDPHTRSLLYNLDITGQNYLTQERNTVIINTEVIQVALSSDGGWLGTVEYNDNGVMSVQITLKFFQFNTKKQNFTLNTSIELPHEGRIYSLNFQPMENGLSGDSDLLAVTTGSDNKFRIWELSAINSIYRKGSVWHCSSVGHYRDLPVSDSSFSCDGSVLGVLFGPTLTLWNPESCELQCSLTPSSAHPNAEEDNRFVEFGNKECCHLVVVGSSSGISVWNILTLSMIWTAPLHLNILTRDPASRFMAAFTSKNTLFIFAPNRSQPVMVKSNIYPEGTSIMSAIFVPRPQPKTEFGDSWQTHSQLYFIDSNQELLALERADEVTDVCDAELDGLPEWTPAPTPFSVLLAKQAASSVVNRQSGTQNQLGLPGRKELAELLSAPAHTMPPVHLLCKSLLHSLVQRTSPMADSDSKEIAEDDCDEKRDSESSDGEEAEGKDSPRAPEVAVVREDVNIQPDLDKLLAPVLSEPMDWVRKLC